MDSKYVRPGYGNYWKKNLQFQVADRETEVLAGEGAHSVTNLEFRRSDYVLNFIMV